jgi:hypothetical protein
LPDKEHRLNGGHVARGVLKQQIVMLETALQRFLHDLVVTVIFAFIPKRSFPGIAILQLRQLDNCHGAFGD